MAKINNISGLFNANGCLTQETIFAYVNGTLADKDLELVKNHIGKCELCADAVDGASQVNPDNYLKDVNDIRTRINLKFSGKDKINRLRMITFAAAAASVIILAGLFFLFKPFQYSDKKEIALAEPTEKKEVERTISPEVTEPISEVAKPVTPKKKKVFETTQSSPILDKSYKSEKDEAMPEEIQEIPEVETLTKQEQSEKEKSISMPATASGMTVSQENESLSEEKLIPVQASRKDRKSSAIKTQYSESKSVVGDKISQGDRVYTFASEMPKFKNDGSEEFVKFIQDSLKNNPQFLQSGFKGDIIASFVVGTAGKIENVKILNIPDPNLHKELVNIFNDSPGWMPGKENGVVVKVAYTVSIKTNP